MAVSRPEVPRRAPRFLSRATAAAIISAAGPFRLLLLTDLLTGMRRGEIGGLQWSDIAWDEGKHGRIYVRRSWGRATTRGRKVRVLPIHPALRPELEAAFRAAPRNAQGELAEAYVFPAPRRGGMRNESWHTAKLVRFVAKRAGITLPPGFVFHDLRKTFGTHVLRATNDLTAVQRLLGHSSPAVTEAVYIGEDMDLLTKSVEGFDFAPSEPPAEPKASTRRLRVIPGPSRRSQKRWVNQVVGSPDGPRRRPIAFIFLEKPGRSTLFIVGASRVFAGTCASARSHEVIRSGVPVVLGEHTASTRAIRRRDAPAPSSSRGRREPPGGTGTVAT